MKFDNKEQEFDFYWNKIFNGLSWNPIEFNTYRFDESLSLPAKFNKLYEMFKKLALNNQQVIDYLKEFSETFDKRLAATVEDILNIMTEDGTLSDLIDNTFLIDFKNELSKKRDKNVQINMSDLDEDVKLAMTGGSVAVVGSQEVDFNNLNARIQKDVGEYTKINFNTNFGGWNDDGTENNDSYPVENYLRSEFLCSGGENIVFKLNTNTIKKFIILDEKNNVLMVYNTNDTYYEINTPSNSFRIKFYYQKSGSLIPSILRLEYVGFQKKGKIDGQSINITKFNEDIQNDIGIFHNIVFSAKDGGWNDDGTENNSENAMNKFKRFIVTCKDGEIFMFNQDVETNKKFVFEDKNNNAITSYESTDNTYTFSSPLEAAYIKVQYQYSGSIEPSIKRLAYDSISSKRYANEILDNKFNDLYFEGVGIGGHTIEEKHLFKDFQVDTGKLSKINLEWYEGGWNDNGSENDSVYAKENYLRAQYNPQQRQTGRILHLDGVWTTNLRVVRTFDENDNLINEYTFENQYACDFEIDNKTKKIKIQVYKTIQPQLSHYIYDSIASKKYVDDRIKNNNNNDTFSSLPDYYFPYIDNKIDEINNLIVDNDGDSFIFLTDVHWGNNAKKSNAIIDYIRNKTGINKIIFGGDIITAYGSKETMMNQNYEFNQYFNNFQLFKDWFPIVGNHDFTIRFNSESEDGSTLNSLQTFNLIFSNLESYITINKEEMCYFVDNNTEKIRYIFINTQDGPIKTDVGWGLTYDVSQSQLNWLTNKALNTDYSIIVIGHIPIGEEMPTYPQNLELVRKTFEAFNNRENLDLTLNEKTVTKDFTNSAGKILFYLSGHNHRDRNFEANNLKHISCGCDALYKDDIYERTPNTISEQIISVFIVDKKEKINLVRIGAGENRII